MNHSCFVMGEMEENGDALDDWRTLVSSPKGLLPSFVSEPFTSKPISEALNGEKVGDESLASVVDNKYEEEEDGVSNIAAIRTGRSIAERRAAKFGFNASRINTARFRTTSPLASPAARSPYLTIPPGISPAALLDSPIMLPNSQRSPTTGTFPLPPVDHENPIMNSMTPTADGDRTNNACSSFRFKPHGSPVSLSCFSGSDNQVSSSCYIAQSLGADFDYKTLAPVQPQLDFEFPAEYLKEVTPKNCDTDSQVSDNMIVSASCTASQICHSSDQMPQHKEHIHREDEGTHHLLEGEQNGTYPPMGMVRTSEVGYNWRKYGQKQVKGSEYPRSYYKCTHPNCQVKKTVERSHDGQITEIIYKGTHNHPKPQPSRRSSMGSSFSFNEMSEMVEGSGSCVKIEGGSVWRNIQPGSKDIRVGSDWRADGLERTSSTSVVTELSDPLSTTQGKSVGVFESAETPELSSTLASHDDDEDGATQGSISLGDDADDDEYESKRRKKESCVIETNMASRAVREPRVVVQIESEVDILDDGYRWRKYGQKVVKGNPNPRSYYKCTSAGCLVRKHVERASHNLKSVITTYEGKHNHEVPAARNSCHVNSSSGHLPPATPIPQPALTLPRNTNVSKPETQVQDLAPRFERKPEFNNEYLRTGFLGNFSNDMKFGSSSIYQMKFPPLQTPMPYGSFGMNLNHNEIHQPGSIGPVVPDFPIPLQLSLPRPANLALAGFDFNNHGNTIGPVQSFLAGQQQLKENEMRFIRPKEEQKDDNPYDACLPIVDHAKASSSSSIFCQIMGGFST
nr:WRKY [Loropetalum chinense var. rubrum]